MKKKYKYISIVFICFFLMGIILLGCTRDNITKQTIFGEVTSDTEEPVQNVHIVAMERSSKKKFETYSDDKGEYLLDIDSGTYDLGADYNGYITEFHGPLTIVSGESVRKDIALESTADAKVSLLRGKIILADGEPAESWIIKFFSSVSDHNSPTNSITTVVIDEDGLFEVDLGESNNVSFNQEYALDLDFYSPKGELVEFIDIVKRAKPCYVEMTINGPVKNEYRHNKGPLISPQPLSSLSANSLLIHPQSSNETFSILLNYSGTYDNPSSGIRGYDDWHGLLRVKGKNYPAEFNFRYDTSVYEARLQIMKENYDIGDIYLDDDGSWWYDYKIHVSCRNPSNIWPMNWQFEDQTHDKYNLWISSESYSKHEVSYNSDHPDIYRIYLSAATTTQY